MDYVEFPPSPDLAPYVAAAWTLRDVARPDAVRPAEKIVPDGHIELVLHLGDPFARVHDDGTETTQPARLLAGHLERYIALRPGARVDVLGVRFRPHGAAPFLACAPAAASGRVADLDELDPRLARDLWRAVHDAAPRGDGQRAGAAPDGPARAARDADLASARVDALMGVLRERLSAAAPPDDLAARAVERLESARGDLAVDDLAAGLGVSTRTLQRRFTAAVGIGPKVLARTLRFQQVLRAIESGRRANMAAAAAACGFSDQSHLVREFRRFAGEPPAAFLQALAGLTEIFGPRRPQHGGGDE